jgi:hypothetical protein
MQLKLEDFFGEDFGEECPSCKEGLNWHEGTVILYVTPTGELECLADGEVCRCERELAGSIRLLKRMLECAISKGLRAYAVSYHSDPGRPFFVHVFGEGGAEYVEWQEFQKTGIAILRLGFRTHREAVEDLEKVSRRFQARVSQEVVAKAFEGKGHEP